MMIITPIILPQSSPSTSDCETLLSYTYSVIGGLESILSGLYEVSSTPDEAMVLIINKVETMLSEASAMRVNLNSIKAGSVNEMSFNNQNKKMV